MMTNENNQAEEPTMHDGGRASAGAPPGDAVPAPGVPPEHAGAAAELPRRYARGELSIQETLDALLAAYAGEKDMAASRELLRAINQMRLAAIPVDDGTGGDETLTALRARLAGRYALERRLAATQVSVVLEGWSLRHGRRVAVKVLRHREPNASLRPAFAREIRLLTTLRHPRVVTLLEHGEVDGVPYFISEYVEGGSAKDWLREPRPGLDRILRAAFEVCEGLEFIHARDIIHLDIKPANLLLDAAGRIKIADFGIARAAGAGLLLAGTRGYAAPEQLEPGGTPDTRSDVYGLGATLYHLATGRRFSIPASGGANSRLPAALQEALCAALSPDQAQRYSDIPAFREALGRCLPGYVRYGSR